MGLPIYREKRVALFSTFWYQLENSISITLSVCPLHVLECSGKVLCNLNLTNQNLLRIFAKLISFV